MNESPLVADQPKIEELGLPDFSPTQMSDGDLKSLDQSGSVQLLYRVLANHNKFSSFSSAMKVVLALGRAQFDASIAMLLRQISDEIFEIQAWSAEDTFFIGQHIAISNLRSQRRFDEKRVFTVDDFAQVTSQPHSKAYNLEEIRACFGASLELSGSERGLLCFFDVRPRPLGITQENRLLLELMAEGIACMTELQKARAQRKTEDLAIFASGSLKSLEEYKQLADLPEGLGISGKVVDVLKKRIGHASLSIDNIAEELNLSKRTLQRRLQQQGISFAELRDKVRFHFAIDILVKQQTSIDRISSTLDFSDRTSFTNAFKRWTGLSPSTFRKVFRDYA